MLLDVVFGCRWMRGGWDEGRCGMRGGVGCAVWGCACMSGNID